MTTIARPRGAHSLAHSTRPRSGPTTYVFTLEIFLAVRN